MPIVFEHEGTFKNAEKILTKKERKFFNALDKYGKQGVEALKLATPKDTGKTSESWSYDIQWNGNGSFILSFSNSNVADDWAPVAILIQYGHATKNGGYVLGRDYINPAIAPIFDKLANDAWKEVIK